MRDYTCSTSSAKSRRRKRLILRKHLKKLIWRQVHVACTKSHFKRDECAKRAKRRPLMFGWGWTFDHPCNMEGDRCTKPRLPRRVSFSDDPLRAIDLEENAQAVNEDTILGRIGKGQRQTSIPAHSNEYLVDVSDRNLLVTRHRTSSSSSANNKGYRLSDSSAVYLEVLCLYTSIIVTLAFFSIPLILIFVSALLHYVHVRNIKLIRVLSLNLDLSNR